jgi:hypothetical protein
VLLDHEPKALTHLLADSLHPPALGQPADDLSGSTVRSVHKKEAWVSNSSSRRFASPHSERKGTAGKLGLFQPAVTEATSIGRSPLLYD